MNKHIRQIALQAGGSHYPEVNQDLLIKYTKLFLEDCISEMSKLDYHAEWLGNELKKHYGFENE